MMMNKKGQAALEFIMTYGWAILVVLVAVGALAYFGVLSPDKFLPSKCTLQSGIACLDHSVTSTVVSVVIQNSRGTDMSGIVVKAENCIANNSQPTLANGAKLTYQMGCSTPLTGTKYKGELNVSYTSAEGLAHNNVGELTTRVS